MNKKKNELKIEQLSFLTFDSLLNLTHFRSSLFLTEIQNKSKFPAAVRCQKVYSRQVCFFSYTFSSEQALLREKKMRTCRKEICREKVHNLQEKVLKREPRWTSIERSIRQGTTLSATTALFSSAVLSNKRKYKSEQ